MNELQYCNRADPADQPGFKTIMVTESVHPYAGAWWPSGHVLGYEHTFVHEVCDFVNAVAGDTPIAPRFPRRRQVRRRPRSRRPVPPGP